LALAKIKQELYNEKPCDLYSTASLSIVTMVTITAVSPSMASLAVMAPVHKRKDVQSISERGAPTEWILVL
jgi:hypothetical protein